MNNAGGQMLIEALIALTVLVLVTVAVVIVSTKSLKLVRLADKRREALGYANSVLDEVEKQRSSDIKQFFLGFDHSDDCGPLGVSGEYSCQIDYVFNSPPDSDNVEVKVSLTWNESGRTFSLTLARVFAKVGL